MAWTYNYILVEKVFRNTSLLEQFEFVVVERKSRMELVVGLEQIGTSKIESVELVGMSTGSAVVEHIHTVSFHESRCPKK